MIDVCKLSYTYTGSMQPAISGLSFRIEPGEIFGFLGPSGAGKSTTQNILTGLLRGYQGRASVLGRDLAGWRPADYARIGVAFELPTYFRKLTGLENLAYFGALYPRTAFTPQAALELVGLEDAGSLPVEQYSKGMQNRLGFARALLHAPELLFLDEPTSGLDPVNARRIKELIRAEQQRGATIFLTTHNMAVAAELCDRVAFLVDGRIALIDTPRTLMLQYGEPCVVVEYASESGLKRASFALHGLGDQPEFLRLLRTGIQTIHSQEATLEDIFVQVTGRRLA